MGGVDADGIHFTQGAWLGNLIREDESTRSLCAETVHMTVWVMPEKALAARLAASEPKWSLWNNCVDHIEKSLDTINYPHPSFKPSPHGVSSPTIYCDWIKQEGHHIHPNFLPQPGDTLVDYSIYDLGYKGPESPGVSMELGCKEGKKKKGCMVVSYFGETENTRFGQVMFEADRVLKILSIGKDNITGKAIKSSIPGYKDLQTIRTREGCPPPKDS